MAIKNGEESIDELKLLSEEEDKIIDQLDTIEKSADKYLNIIINNNEGGNFEITNMVDDRIYKDAILLNENVKQIDYDIKKVEDEMFTNSQKQNMSINNLINCNPKFEEKVKNYKFFYFFYF